MYRHVKNIRGYKMWLSTQSTGEMYKADDMMMLIS